MQKHFKEHENVTEKLEMYSGRFVIDSFDVQNAAAFPNNLLKNLKLRYFSRSHITKWKSYKRLHFKNCNLSGVTMLGGKIEGCVFEACNLDRISFFGTAISNTRFEDCSLKSAHMGGHIPVLRQECSFEQIEFDCSNLEASTHSDEKYTNCIFRNCRVDGVEFRGAVFKDCKFTGKLRNVLFERDYAFGKRTSVHNTMLRCDFTSCLLVNTYFRNIDLDKSMFSSTEDMIWLWRGPKDWIEWASMVDPSSYPGGLDCFAREMAKAAGTPTLVYKSTLFEFPDDDVEALIELSKRYKPSDD